VDAVPVALELLPTAEELSAAAVFVPALAQ
jgi:hypothetical protein